MQKFTDHQITFLFNLVFEAMIGLEYSYEDRRSGESLLRTGLVEYGYDSYYKLTDLGRREFNIEKLMKDFGLCYLVNDPIYAKYTEKQNLSSRLASEVVKAEPEVDNLCLDSQCIGDLIFERIESKRYMLRKLVREKCHDIVKTNT